MARYVDADALIKKMFPLGIGDGMYTINAKAVKFAIDNTPTADVAPKSEVEKLIIDRNAARLGMIAEHERLKTAKADVAREIFDEIDKIVKKVNRIVYKGVDITPLVNSELPFGYVRICDLAELKKKYTDGETKDYFTPEEVRAMSPKQVRDNYQAIMQSIKKWGEEK